MTKLLNGRAVHPFLIGIYPILALLATNIEAIPATMGLRSIAVSLLIAVAVFYALRLLLRDRLKAALLASLALVLFYSYGHVYNYLEAQPVLGLALGRHRLLIPIWAALLTGGTWWILRSRRDLLPATRALNAIAAILLIFPLAQIGLFGLRTLQASSAEKALTSPAGGLRVPQGQPSPDIYYIILDGYSRDDILKKFYDLDNTPFLQGLEQMGFTVARCSQSNYAQTQLSLASSLNYDYIENLGDQYRAGSTSRVGLAELVRNSAVRQALHSLGYKIVAFETGFAATQLEDADVYLAPRLDLGVNDFENLFIRTTAARILAEGVAFLHLRPDWEARDEAQRERIIFALEKLRNLPQEVPGPKFVFAHIVAPHWPHVFGPNGEKVHERPDSVDGYRNQVIFLNKQVLPIFQQIISRSATPPVIVVQGDHGAVIESQVQRMSILNAYYLPSGGEQKLYENISPVNTFRLILDHYFGGNFPFLPDISYYSIYERPYEFNMIPNTRPGCP